ncbi:MAG: flavin reductase family protein [Butyrivibrio sp.]|uniref:flavin reductase family protein n=1 Tax=Butyrivibrio sp. TaxID=28121 RepID=UPI0025EC9EDE|nr:flavin reductase family protein [Butyrivibrio sp.]MCR5772583.1 flavin reductase family protein [Butyrivibrio sp.]
MSKIQFPKPGNFIYPVPAVMVSCQSADEKPNIITIAWTGTVCSDPPMAYISVRKERHSYQMIKDSGCFVINLPDKDLARACDYCGCTSGRKVDKFKECHLTPAKSSVVSAPMIEEAPVSIECKVTQIIPLGTHDMFLAEVVAVHVDEKYMDEKNAFHMDDIGMFAYEHGTYRELGAKLGTFGYSVRKKPTASKSSSSKKPKNPASQAIKAKKKNASSNKNSNKKASVHNSKTKNAASSRNKKKN